MKQRSPTPRRQSRTAGGNELREKRRRSARSSHSTRPPSSRSPLARPRRNPLIWMVILGVVGAAIFLFFDRDGRPKNLSQTSATADAILLEMQAAYKNINSYSDKTNIQLRVPDPRDPTGERWIDETALLRVDFQRPNLARVQIERPGYDVRIDVSSDRKHLRAIVQDPGTNDFDNQVVQQAAPGQITTFDIYSATSYADVGQPGKFVSLLMELPAPLSISQLSLLLDDQPLEGLLKKATHRERLADERLAGSDCHRVAIDTDRGQFIFWIETTTHLLHRMEFPTRAGGEKNLGKLSCDYSSISTEPSARDRFHLPIPAEARLVRNFVLPPTDAPSPRLNKTAGDYTFTTLAGKSVTPAAVDNQTCLFCWFDDRRASEIVLSQLQVIHDALPPEERIPFLAICADPVNRVKDADIEQRLKQWKITLPVVRDLAGFGVAQFDVRSAPTLVVMDANGVIQLHEQGIDPNLDAQLPGVLKLVADGKPIAADYLKFLNRRQQAYAQLLTAASWDTPNQPVSTMLTEIAPKSNPQQLKITKLWENTEIKHPGNLYAHRNVTGNAADEAWKLLVHDGWQHIVELDVSGVIQRRHAVAATEANAVHRLRSAVDRTGRRYFLGWSLLSRGVVVLNDHWQTVCTYPAEESGHGGIQAADIGDLDGDGTLEFCVSFASKKEQSAALAGTHCVALDGHPLWRARDAGSAISLTRAVDQSGGRFLMTTTEAGQIVPIDADGVVQQPIQVGSRAVHQLFASDADDPSSVFCGFTVFPNGEMLALALDGSFAERWAFLLPAGRFRNQIEFVTTANWFENSLWWVMAGADGSVSLVSHDGNFEDRFQVGYELSGIAAYRSGDTNVLLLSGPQGVSAWQVEAAPTGE